MFGVAFVGFFNGEALAVSSTFGFHLLILISFGRFLW